MHTDKHVYVYYTCVQYVCMSTSQLLKKQKKKTEWDNLREI